MGAEASIVAPWPRFNRGPIDEKDFRICGRKNLGGGSWQVTPRVTTTPRLAIGDEKAPALDEERQATLPIVMAG